MPALISERWRRAVLLVAAVAAFGLAGLILVVHRSGATSFDTWALKRATSLVGYGAGGDLLRLSDPGVSASVIVLIAVLAAVARRWRLVVLAALAPGAAVLITEGVLKPLVGRYMEVPGLPAAASRALYSGAFPSGHETGVASAAVLAAVAIARLPAGRAVRLIAAGVLVVWTALAALGLVRNFYHYATDTLGAVGVALVVVLGGALAIDAATPALIRRRQLT